MTRLLAQFVVVMMTTTTMLPALAKSVDGRKPGTGMQRFIVLYEDEPLVRRLAPERATATAASSAGDGVVTGHRLDLQSPGAQTELQRIGARQSGLEAEAATLLGRELVPVFRYRVALNGIATDLTPAEAKHLSKMSGIARVLPDRIEKLQTYAGPTWIGAADIWNGAGSIPETRGEGVIVGIIDSGINWNSPSFEDAGEGSGSGHDHVNPLGEQLDLCAEADVACNDKLIGVYDFVEDNPGTEVVEENNGGADNTDHGSHVAAIAAGNPVNVSLNGEVVTLSGVAPNANIISYRVCFLGDPEDVDDDGCQSSAIAAAIDQAVTDGVDVINYSIGSGPFSPWNSVAALAFLNAFDAGIFVATSAGNDGPGEGTVGSPAMAPWITAVGSATHDQIFASILQATEGGATTPPGDLIGASFTADGLPLTDIVYAGDYGFPLCGTGTAELEPTCGENTGATNPFADGLFDGKIVVCDRGTYGRIEKGKNVQEAGAVGYVLANTDAQGEEILADEHCLPSTHLGDTDGDVLRAWLASGSGHRASLTGFSVVSTDVVADIVSGFSSRGPTPAPVQDVLKPDLIAPGQDILAAAGTDDEYIFQSGTSMASPHVTGAAALLKAVDPGMTPSMIASALTTTATVELARDENGLPATRHEAGHGRPQLGEAAGAGLYFEETATRFEAANPDLGGKPGELNLPSMTESNCAETCSFTRTVKPLVANRSWTVDVAGVPAGVDVTVTPSAFTLGSLGSEQEIVVDVDVAGANFIGEWIFVDIQLTSSGLPPVTLPLSVFASGGELPLEWNISTNEIGGSRTFALDGLAALPQASITAGGLVAPDAHSMDLVEDETFTDPYDGGPGVFTVLVDVPENAMWFGSRTLASPADDLDLFVGRDSNGNGQADEFEEVCASLTAIDLEACDIFTPEPGTWWVLVQNWEDCPADAPANDPCEGASQEATVQTAVVIENGMSSLTATGPGQVESNAAFAVRVSWDNLDALPDEEVWGAVGIGRTLASSNDVGVIPVILNRTGIDTPRTRVLMDNRPFSFALDANATHDRMFVDVPPGANLLQVSADGETDAQDDALVLRLYRQDFDNAFGNVPEAGVLPGGAADATDNGGIGNGPSVELAGGQLTPGRWYVAVENQSGSPVPVTVDVVLGDDGSSIPLSGGLWAPSLRTDDNGDNLGQGFEYNSAGNNRAVLWYTYEQNGQPTWYLAADPRPTGNTWTTELLRFTNDGDVDWSTEVGTLSVTLLGDGDGIYSWNLFGVSGSDRIAPLGRTCAPGGNYSGLWGEQPPGKGGASVVVNSGTQGQIHYIYDDHGDPRWLIGAADGNATEIPLLQFEGFCPNCSGVVANTEVGVLTPGFSSNDQGTWGLDYVLATPLDGDVDRTDSPVKLTDDQVCP